MRRIVINCSPIFKGIAEGEALVTTQPISFWGGLDPVSGVVTDTRHELYGKCVSGKVLIFPYSKGSVSGTTVFLELIRRGRSPIAIVNLETEPLIALAAVLADKMYHITIPIVDRPDKDVLKIIKTGDKVRVDAESGIITVVRY